MNYTVVDEGKEGRRLLAKTACRKCWGRGYVGFINGRSVPCDCLQSAKIKIPEPEQPVSWFKRLLNKLTTRSKANV